MMRSANTSGYNELIRKAYSLKRSDKCSAGDSDSDIMSYMRILVIMFTYALIHVALVGTAVYTTYNKKPNTTWV